MNIDFSKEQKDNFSVILSNNKRYVSDPESELDFYNGRKTLISPQNLKSYVIKDMLFDGDIRVVEGDVIYRKKKSIIFISSEKNGFAYYKEDDKIYEKDLDTGQVILMKEDEKDIGCDFF